MSSSNPHYFHHLNYSLGNEDSSVEYEALPEQQGQVLCVAGSGSRVLPLLARHPERLVCVDVSPEQLFLTELRVQAARVLRHAEYLELFGYPPHHASAKRRRELFDRVELTEAACSYLKSVFENRAWGSILYEGRWERTFGKLARLNARLTGARGRALFDARTPEEHRAYMRDSFPRKAWLLTLLLLGNPLVFNLMLYRGDFPRMNLPGSPFAFYRQAFDNLFALGPSRQNFFLQIVFFGQLRFEEGNPIECRPDVYDAIQRSLATTKVAYHAGDIIEVARDEGPFDFVSLSDIASYFEPPREQSYLRELRPALNRGGRVVVRYYLRKPEGTDRAGYEESTRLFSSAIAREKVGVYAIEVFDLAS